MVGLTAGLCVSIGFVLFLREQLQETARELAVVRKALDEQVGKARNLKDKASWLRQNEATANLNAERRLRDHAALETVTEEGLPVSKGPNVLRPDIGDKDLPFYEGDKVKQAQRNLLQQKIPEINLTDTDMNYVLELLSKTTGINIVYDPADIQGKNVTIRACDLTLEDVLKYLCRTKELGYTVDRDTVWVFAGSN
jgi:type II secretory pathway component HofQ